MRKLAVFLLFIFPLLNCSDEKNGQPNSVFEKIPSEKSGFQFLNKIENTREFNIFNYRNFYNGGGVGIGDINNDGFADIYMTGNLEKNKLFLNKGDFKFEDITENAGVAGERAWSTGVVMVDVNNDGWLDIYVCNAGYVEGDDQQNELFINNRDLTFTEKAAEYGLNYNGYTTHAAFFDYDLDGDLDVYLLNNSFIPVNTLNYENKRDLPAEQWPVKDFLKGGGDKLMRNDDGKFVDVTKDAGIYSSLIGFGLGITIGDVNGDMWPDMYVSNDFFERDYLYVNQGDGTFKEEIKNWMQHLSLSSMGADMADINNDGYPEIFVTEMLPDNDYRLKTTTIFEDYKVQRLKLDRDFYYQFMQNTLQFNNKNNSFSEVAFYSGVAASDWSWGALMMDADNDGFKDIYVCNGIFQDVIDQDFVDFFANEIIQKMVLTGKKEEMENVVSKMPSNPQVNKFFHNNGDLTFEDAGKNFGFTEPSFSNGAAYGDLDNDGDLDLVVNNLNQESFLYRNNSRQLNGRHYLSVQLSGSEKNTFAIGSSVMIFKNGEKLSTQLIPSRGFQSSVDYKMVFGLGADAHIDSLKIFWFDRTVSTLTSLPADTLLKINYSDALRQPFSTFLHSVVPANFLEEITQDFEAHSEDDFTDFFQEGLIIRELSSEGPRATIGDLDGDRQDDLFVCGAAGQPGQVYFWKNGKYTGRRQPALETDAGFEDTAAAFFDADGDGDLDLYVGSGGNHKPAGSNLLQDRIYLNDGKGNLKRDENALPVNGYNTAFCLPFDVENDGDLDLLVGSRSTPGVFGVPARSYFFKNEGNGKFSDSTREVIPDFLKSPMLTQAKWVDLWGDKTPELVVTAEWSSPKIYEWQVGKLNEKPTDLAQFSGWWYALESADLDGDGDQDLILGNRGDNFCLHHEDVASIKLWLYDFDKNGTTEKIITKTVDGKDVPVHLKKELTEQIVSLKKKNLKNTDYAVKSVQDLFAPEVLQNALVKTGNYFRSAVALNLGNGKFELKNLPEKVQFSSVNAIYCHDLNADGKTDLVLGGNESGFKPQFSKLDASFGHILLGKGDGTFDYVDNCDSGFFVKGDIRQLAPVSFGDEHFLLCLLNNQKPKFFKIKGD